MKRDFQSGTQFCQAHKKKMFDKRAAVSAANKIWKERGVKLRTYSCPDCSWWHLSKSL